MRKQRCKRRKGMGPMIQVHQSLEDIATPQADPLQLLLHVTACRDGLIETALFQQTMSLLETTMTLLQNCRQRPTSVADWQIICYGVGNFSRSSPTNWSAPLWQLAFIMSIRDRLRSVSGESHGGDASAAGLPVAFYDPCATPIEQSFLTDHLQVHVITEDECGRRAVNGHPTLFFMPHCPLFLYEEVLRENWRDIPVTPMLIIGNSFLSYFDNGPTPPDCPCMHALLTSLHEDRLAADLTKDQFRHLPGDAERAFNNTVVIDFRRSLLGQDLSKCSQESLQSQRGCSAGGNNDPFVEQT